MKKSTYILIAMGFVIILGIGVLIGLNVNDKLQNINANKNNEATGNVVNNDDIEVKEQDVKEIVVKVPEPIVKVVEIPIETVKVNTSNVETKTETKVEEVKVNTNVNNDVSSESIDNKVEDTKVETNPISYSDKDTKVIETLEETYNNIKNSEVTEKFSDSAKATFINVVDFLFYNGTIKGVTFNELTDNGKAKVLELANKIDEKIESKVPNYKDKISSTASKAYKEASELIKKGSANLNDFLKAKLSNENYNAIINSKEDLVYYSKNAVSFIKDHGSKLLSTAKDKLSEWYSKYKNS